MKRVLFLLLVVLPAAVLPASPARAEAGMDDEYELLRLVNDARGANGLPAVEMDGRLQNDARNFSGHLLRVAFEHDPNMPWYDCSLRSENVAFGQRTVAQVHNDFMNSAAHRANILRSGINAAGFGVSYSSSGAMYTVQRFYRCPSVAPAQYTSGPVRAKWLAMGGAPSLGRYQGTPAPIYAGGEYQVFGGGSDSGIPSSAIYWHRHVDGGRAHVTYGPLWGKWGELGFETGKLGYPATDPFSAAYCRTALNPTAQGFQFGVIIHSAATGARVLEPGPTFDKYAAAAAHCGPAGLPTSDLFDWPGAEGTWRAQTFEFRWIAEHKPSGATFFCTYQNTCV